MKKKTAIKLELYDLFVEGHIKYEDFKKYWNSVKFLSKKDTDIWFNELIEPEVRVFYNS